MRNNELMVSMDLRTYNLFVESVERENLNVSFDEESDDLNFGVEALTSATMLGITSAVLTSIVAIVKRIIPENKRVEIKIGDDIYKFENYSLEEIEKLMAMSDKNRMISVVDKED